MSKLLSFVVPIYNEADGLSHFHTQLLQPVLDKLSYDTEVIYVNDGSADATATTLKKIAATSNVKIVSLSRNFGKEAATTAGIAQASGSAVIIMDGDGQHPPSLIPKFIAAWEKGAQVVVGIRNSNQKEGVVKKWGSRLFYKLFNSLSGTILIPRSTDFRLIDKIVQKEFVKFPEHSRMTRALIDWLGFRREYVYFDSPARFAGAATYSTKKLIELALNSFVSLSIKPLIFLSWTGAIITALAFLAGAGIFIEQFLLRDPLHLQFTGAALLGVFISFLDGLILISQGVIALYLSHIHTHAQARPLYVIDSSESTGLK